ncbi:MAG: Crp/Fnr family transcriptional regulator [Eubacteriales bacterium]|nr:Crp/Fnr family transcriptional regulator [Eubacteriales bacterium]MDD4389854.1 Crp/Fnr family transcriptional regulator [Eubacteriales bacterium]
MNDISGELKDIFPCWVKLTEKQRDEVNRHTDERHFKKGQFPHRGDVECTGLLMVKSGQIRAFMLSESGKEITLYRLLPWDVCLFSASCIMNDINFELHLEAEKDTVVFVVPAEIYGRLMKTSLPVSEYTRKLMASRFSDVVWIVEQVLFKRFDSRLASFLLEQMNIDNTDTLLITHDEIARHMGSAREVVTKMLNYFSNEGIVALSRGKIKIQDEKMLQGIV